jgi:DNA polymerase-3 subunit delta'
VIQLDVFIGLTGQQAVKDKLRRLSRQDAAGHAHLLLGDAGMGKRRFARAFAKMLLCGGADFAECAPCGNCMACRLFNTGALDDYFFAEPSGQGQKMSISVDTARRIKDWFSLRPLYSPRKVCVIAQADHMTEQAQNALLKTLEEPPAYGIAILTASNPGMLLDTVQSRCAVTRLSGYSENELCEILRAITAKRPSDSHIGLLARLSDGNPGQAIDLARSESFLTHREELIRLFCGHIEGDARMSLLLSEFLDKNKVRFRSYGGILILWLRDLWFRTLMSGIPPVNEDMAGRMAKYDGRYSQGALLDCIERIDGACASLDSNANFTLAVNTMLYTVYETLNAA